MTDQKQPGTLRIRWSVIGLSGLILGIGSLGTLVTVVTLNSIDALSTVALVLAVLAFVIQIIVFIAQTAAANQQAVDNQAVNAQTRELLAELRANTQQTNNTLADQYNMLLNRVFTSLERDLAARPAGPPDDGVDLAKYREEVLTEVAQVRAAAQEELNRLREGPAGRWSQGWLRETLRAEQAKDVSRYQAALDTLLAREINTAEARDLFYSFVRGSAWNSPGGLYDTSPDEPAVKELIALDLLRRRDGDPTTLVLTDRGEALLRRARKMGAAD